MLKERGWLPKGPANYARRVGARLKGASAQVVEERLMVLVKQNRSIHERLCMNLNPATNVMNPKAEALLAQGLGSRPSLGYPGDKYEMGLEAVEEIEIIAAELASEVFGSSFAELRVSTGAMANMYVFMAAARAGDPIIVPPPSAGGHVTHHAAGAAGLFGLVPHYAPVDTMRYTLDASALREQALRIRPKVISVGGSLNLFPHPVREIRDIADEVGAIVLFDAAHLSGLIAGGAWPSPLAQGAHVMTMSTYKSLGGPPSGLILTNDPALAQRLDAIAYPGLTANFDVGKIAALALTLLDWKIHGAAYAKAMVETARALGVALVDEGAPVFARDQGITRSHQLALEARRYGGGQAAARRLRQANLLASGIGLPLTEIPGDMNGLRFGTPEMVRTGVGPNLMPELARLIVDVLHERRPAEIVGKEVTTLRGRSTGLQYIRA